MCGKLNAKMFKLIYNVTIILVFCQIVHLKESSNGGTDYADYRFETILNLNILQI